MAAQMEAGHCCPITMTHAAVATLRHEPVLLRSVLPKLVARSYDPRFAPWQKKQAITVGMGMTERQGGTDVRTNITTATPLNGNGGGKAYAITGHKWFLSAPMSDAFLVLARQRWPVVFHAALRPTGRSTGSGSSGLTSPAIAQTAAW
jgi:putative acyl-CoA dehydrogenase